MEFGGKFVYVGPEEEEEVVVAEQRKTLATNFQSNDADDGETCMLDIFDTAGQEEYSALREQYMKVGEGFLLVYDITNRKSLEDAKKIYEWTKAVRDENNLPAVLCGNKVDLESERQISQQEGIAAGKKMGIEWIETSAKTGYNVAAAFETLVRKIPRRGVSYKIPVLGDGGVGKSSLTVQYVSNTFVESYDPTIEDSYRKRVTISGLTPAQSASGKPKTFKKKSGFFGNLKRRLSGKRKSRPEIETRRSTHPAEQDEANLITEKVPKADTNFILVSMGKLSQNPELVTGDPTYCKNCPAVLSRQDIQRENLTTINGKTLWICDFCCHKNEDLNLTEEEIPEGPTFDFMLKPAPAPETSNTSKSSDGLVIFCIDVSGSMDMKADIPKFQAMWRNMRDGKKPNNSEEWSKTRLGCIKEAVTRQMESLQGTYPNKRVAIVTFGSDVYVCGDGTQEVDTITGDTSYEELLDQGMDIHYRHNLRTLTESLSELSTKVNSLSTTGCTALGPALTLCVGMTAPENTASEIILCTDGCPNVGVGSDTSGNDNFYIKVGQAALQNNTVVNILAVEGESVALKCVGQVAAVTKGTVNIVTPLEMTRQIRYINQNPVVATAVDVRVLLHPSLVFVEDEGIKRSNSVIKEVGTASQDTDLTFRYTLQDKNTLTDQQALPFQVQITYTLLNGMKCLRVITKHQEATTDREKNEKNVNVAVLGLAAVQQTSVLAANGNTSTARRFLHSVERLMKRGAVTSVQQEEHYSFVSETEEMDKRLKDICISGDMILNDGDVHSNLYQRNASCNLRQFQGASSKKDAVRMRGNFDQQQREQYYGFQC